MRRPAHPPRPGTNRRADPRIAYCGANAEHDAIRDSGTDRNADTKRDANTERDAVGGVPYPHTRTMRYCRTRIARFDRSRIRGAHHRDPRGAAGRAVPG